VRLLLDTHVLIWLFSGDPAAPKLRERHRAAILAAETVSYSVASLWEIVVKVRLGRLRVALADVTGGAAEVGFELFPVRESHLAALAALPLVPEHRDPFDHLLIAQAIAEDMTLMSVDRHAPRYPVRLLA